MTEHVQTPLEFTMCNFVQHVTGLGTNQAMSHPRYLLVTIWSLSSHNFNCLRKHLQFPLALVPTLMHGACGIWPKYDKKNKKIIYRSWLGYELSIYKINSMTRKKIVFSRTSWIGKESNPWEPTALWILWVRLEINFHKKLTEVHFPAL